MAEKNSNTPVVLSILELGGYPDFSKLYQSLGYRVHIMESMRKALKFIKNNRVDVIVAEFNFQSDFRDRSSQLESLMASIAQKPGVDVVVFYDREQEHQFQRVAQRYRFIGCLRYPVDETELAAIIEQRTAAAV